MDTRRRLRACVSHLHASAGAAAGEDDRRTAALFVDFADVSSQRNLQRTFHQAEKHGTKPVLTQGEPWERAGGMCGSVVFDEEQQLFKAWYMAGEDHAHTVCLATSTDGVHFQRPALGLHGHGDDTTAATNIVIPNTHHDGKDHFETMLKDPTDPDPAKRYKAIGWSSFDWDGPLSGIFTATSADGTTWEHPDGPKFAHNPRSGSDDLGPVGDAQSLMVDTARGRFVAFLRGAGSSRTLSTSEDFVSWTPPHTFLEAQHELEGMYNNTGFNYGAQYLGFLTYFDKHADRQSQELRLLTSRDGEQWQRVAAGEQPLIACGEVGSWDRFQIMLVRTHALLPPLLALLFSSWSPLMKLYA
jgi:hypothetical protein